MISGHICFAKTYHYNGWDFEYGYSVWQLKKNGELRTRCGKKFLNDLDGFFKLSEKDKKQFRTGGGRIKF